MAGAHEHRNPRRQAPTAAGARALVILLVLAAFVLAPFMSAVERPWQAMTPHVAQVVSNPGKHNQRCPKKSLLGQPSACAASSVPVAGIDGLSVIQAPVARRADKVPLYDLTLATQCCGVPPDRPPRLAA